MEFMIGELIKNALTKPNKKSIAGAAEGLEQFALLIVNAFGMMEERIVELENTLGSLQKSIEELTKRMQSPPVQMSPAPSTRIVEVSAKSPPKAVPVEPSPGKAPAIPVQRAAVPIKPPLKTIPSAPSSIKPPPKPIEGPEIPSFKKFEPQAQSSREESSEDIFIPRSEDDLIKFRKSLLKPVTEQEKHKAKPISLRGLLISEMKEQFSSAMKKVKDEQ